MFAHTQRMMVGDGKKISQWKYTINTEATTEGDVLGAIPFNLCNTEANLKVNWGDGSSSILTPSMYTPTSSNQSIHTYSEPGIYQITVTTKDAKNIYMLSDTVGYGTISSGPFNPCGILKKTLISLDSSIPNFSGVLGNTGGGQTNINNGTKYDKSLNRAFFEAKKLTTIPSNLFINTKYTSLYEAFEGCTNLSSVPESLFLPLASTLTNVASCFSGCEFITSVSSGLLNNCPNLTNINSFFHGWKSLTSIPEQIIINCKNITSLYAFLYNCVSLTNFSIIVTSPSISNITAFCPQTNNGYNRIIHVIPNSITEATFQNGASSYYLTIVSDVVV